MMDFSSAICLMMSNDCVGDDVMLIGCFLFRRCLHGGYYYFFLSVLFVLFVF